MWHFSYCHRYNIGQVEADIDYQKAKLAEFGYFYLLLSDYNDFK